MKKIALALIITMGTLVVTPSIVTKANEKKSDYLLFRRLQKRLYSIHDT